MHLVGLPKAVVLLPVLVGEDAVALLHVVDPLAVVGVAVGEDVDALPVHLAVVPVALVDAAVRVLVLPVTVHLAVDPVALELLDDATSRAHVRDDTLAVPLVVFPLALVDVALRVAIRAAAVHLPVVPFAVVLVVVGVGERTDAMDAAVLPSSLVAIARGEHCDALSMDPVLHPLALEDGSVGIGKPAVALALAEDPLALVALVARVDERALAVEEAVLNLPVVGVARVGHHAGTSSIRHRSRGLLMSGIDGCSPRTVDLFHSRCPGQQPTEASRPWTRRCGGTPEPLS
mmetsp:Transcript_44330/g.96809  ORF Transcript_44330/g.96809 Transcript_44330/m.96809 type:complete len:289 (+) Transcript_44330:594-1460(+)